MCFSFYHYMLSVRIKKILWGKTTSLQSFLSADLTWMPTVCGDEPQWATVTGLVRESKLAMVLGSKRLQSWIGTVLQWLVCGMQNGLSCYLIAWKNASSRNKLWTQHWLVSPISWTGQMWSCVFTHLINAITIPTCLLPLVLDSTT